MKLPNYLEISPGKKRCGWVSSDPLYIDYHDKEWGLPIFDDKLLFEFLILEGAQAGLSWITILKKREFYRQYMDKLDPELLAHYNEDKMLALMANPLIIRNRLKILAAINNAKIFLSFKEKGETFSDYIWHFSQGKPIHNHWQNLTEIPARTALSDLMSKDMKKRGFKFVGSTICYAFMQAVGIVNDHLIECFRHNEVKLESKPTFYT